MRSVCHDVRICTNDETERGQRQSGMKQAAKSATTVGDTRRPIDSSAPRVFAGRRARPLAPGPARTRPQGGGQLRCMSGSQWARGPARDSCGAVFFFFLFFSIFLFIPSWFFFFFPRGEWKPWGTGRRLVRLSAWNGGRGWADAGSHSRRRLARGGFGARLGVYQAGGTQRARAPVSLALSVCRSPCRPRHRSTSPTARLAPVCPSMDRTMTADCTVVEKRDYDSWAWTTQRAATRSSWPRLSTVVPTD